MSYSYEEEKPWVFTDDGQRQLLKMRDWVLATLKTAGAFRVDKAMSVVSTPDSFKILALVDRLVEIGDIIELRHQSGFAQHRVYVESRR